MVALYDIENHIEEQKIFQVFFDSQKKSFYNVYIWVFVRILSGKQDESKCHS